MDRGDGPAAVPSCFFACEDPRSTRAFDAVFFRSVVHDADAGHLGRVVLRDAGESAGGISQANPPQAFANIQPDSDGYLWVAQDKFQQSFCQDLSAEEALVMAVTQKAPVGSTFGDAVTDPAWKKKPCWYQISAADRMIHPDNQKMMAERMQPRKTITLDASHASLASRPQEVAALIVEAANAVGA